MNEMKKTKKPRMAATANSLKIRRRRLCHSQCSRCSLPDDLLVQILSRLPLKSTLRFRCVSKEWLALLSDPGPYSVRYLCPTICGFFYRRPHLAGSWQYAPIHPYKDHHLDLNNLTSHLPDHRNLNLLDSCNGLLLLGCRENRSYKSMIICNPFRNDETNWVTIHINGALKRLSPLRHFVSAKLMTHRVSPHFKCALLFGDYHFNEWGIETFIWYTMLSSDRGQSHNINHLSQDVSPMFDIYDIAFGDDYPKLCIVREDEIDNVLCFELNKSWTGRVRSLLGVSRGLAHFAFCDDHELHIYILVKEDGERVWKLKHTCSSQPLIKQHKELHRYREDEDNERVYSILPLGFHPDFDVIFLQIEWRIYSFHLSSGSLDEVAGERGANPAGEKFLFHSFTMDPSASLGERREYHMGLPEMDP
ncbi:uncharacterized protein LOC135618065 [Musa acuminata AAA Group]|uniref:uncharacterized protein LOC135618065 n=1 Tax=Musa acuminata AAA Group TaxID=214697 RepID=UPI0031CFAF81